MQSQCKHKYNTNVNQYKCKGCCLGSLCCVKNTLHVLTTLQQRFSIGLLHEQTHTAELLGVKMGLQRDLVYKTVFLRLNQVIKLFKLLFFPT